MDAARTLAATPSRRRRWWIAAAAVMLAILALVEVQVINPRVHVRWQEGITPAQRGELERRYDLAAGEPVEGSTWRYELRDPSRDTVGALVNDPAVADTGYIDRTTLTVPGREVQVSFSRVRALAGPAPAGLVQPQSLILFAAAGLLLWAAAQPAARARRNLALAAVLAVGISAYVVPLRQPIRMGDADTYTHSRESFEMFSGVGALRFEAHLSHAILGRLDALFGSTAESPARALNMLMAAATAWFVLSALAVGVLEGWSPLALRYLALVLFAPSALLFFGYRELGQLSLNAAAFPLLVRGLRSGSARLEAGSALVGFGAALHGFGLLSLAGGTLAALTVPERIAVRLRLALRLVAWSVAAYLGWVALYLVVLKLPLVPGHAEAIPFRPWLVPEVGDRLNAAIVSWLGLRDIGVELLVVGAALLLIVAAMRRRVADARLALAYSVPSVLFLVAFWPIQGLAVEMDLVFAAFPATYALAWVCAHDARRTVAAAVILALAHLVFWRVVLDTAFVNSRL